MEYKRLYREQNPETKEKISNSMKEYHRNKGTEAARSCASKQSEAMKRYWAHIPSKSEYDRQNNQHITMQKYIGAKTVQLERNHGKEG